MDMVTSYMGWYVAERCSVTDMQRMSMGAAVELITDITMGKQLQRIQRLFSLMLPGNPTTKAWPISASDTHNSTRTVSSLKYSVVSTH
jgi:hypothetical protein